MGLYVDLRTAASDFSCYFITIAVSLPSLIHQANMVEVLVPMVPAETGIPNTVSSIALTLQTESTHHWVNTVQPSVQVQSKVCPHSSGALAKYLSHSSIIPQHHLFEVYKMYGKSCRGGIF